MRRLFVTALLLSGCGFDQGDLSVAVERSGLAAAADYDVRVFGAAVTCASVLEQPASYLTGRACSDAEVETAKDCHLVHALLQPGATNRLDAIAEGQRAVFVVGRDADKHPVSKGCSDAAVKSGEAAQVTVSLTEGF